MIRLLHPISDFNRMRRDNCYYIDRSNYIERLENFGYYVLFVRPRRFGKSLFLSTLEHYYDVNQKEHFQLLFGDLYIGQNPTPLANQFMILRFDFSGMDNQNATQLALAFTLKVKMGIKDFLGKYPQFRSAEDEQYILNQPTAATALSAFFGVYKSLKRKVASYPIYVLIDEYDQFTNELLSQNYSEFQAAISSEGYIRSVYEIFKEEAGLGNVGRIFLTGVAPMTLDALTSGFNIAKNASSLEQFHSMLGFTEGEVAELLRKMDVKEGDLPQLLNDLRYWYDGYRFHHKPLSHLYNPEMVLYFASYYLTNREYPVKMLTASVATDYKKIAKIFNVGGKEAEVLVYLNELLVEGEIKSYMTDFFNIELGFGITEIVSMLYYMGLTTIKEAMGNRYTFMMPNSVIKSLYYDYFINLQFGNSYGNMKYEIQDAINKMLWEGDVVDFVGYVEKALVAHSNRDNKGFNEKHLKTLIIGLLFPYETYMIHSEFEHKKKYVDIFLERIPQVNIKHEIIFELKYIKKENELKWADKDGNIVDAPAKKSRKKVATLAPNTPPVKPLLEDVAARGLEQLANYMKLPRFQRENLLGFCLVFVNTECKRILPYTSSSV